ncbi:MAG: hypothetical protein KDB29_11230, partial [Planctomycetes bacterium]|nr:hypothetical protein [Planctomycetota bacterium]
MTQGRVPKELQLRVKCIVDAPHLPVAREKHECSAAAAFHGFGYFFVYAPVINVVATTALWWLWHVVGDHDLGILLEVKRAADLQLAGIVVGYAEASANVVKTVRPCRECSACQDHALAALKEMLLKQIADMHRRRVQFNVLFAAPDVGLDPVDLPFHGL